MELSKSDKRIARKLIDTAIQREFAKCLLRAGEILKEWNPASEDNKPAYYALFTHVTDFDKHIARRYDALKGWEYVYRIAELLKEGIISPEELDEFSEESRNALMSLYSLFFNS